MRHIGEVAQQYVATYVPVLYVCGCGFEWSYFTTQPFVFTRVPHEHREECAA